MPIDNIIRENDQLISTEVQELINHRPGWLVRKGNLLFCTTLGAILIFAWVIRYPDIVSGPIKLVAVDAPKLLVAKKDGKLQKLLVVSDQEIDKDQPMAFLQSTAAHEQVLQLQNIISRLESKVTSDSLENSITGAFPKFGQLGELQPAYQDFENTLKETQQVFYGGFYRQKEMVLQNDYKSLQNLSDNIAEQENLVRKDYELQKFELDANESLAKEKVIAQIELNQNKSKLINKRQILQQIAAQKINNSLTLLNKKKELLEITKYISDQHQRFKSAFFSLKSRVNEWIQQYVIISPEKGKVLFASFLEENQLLSINQELFFIQPPQSKFYGQMLASQAGLGKIKPGQRVLIRLPSYPSAEYGYLSGQINYVSNIPNSAGTYLIKVELPKGLTTNYNRIISFKNNLDASAEVMTDNRRLIERFFSRFRDINKYK